jgi:hypothetical protein
MEELQNILNRLICNYGVYLNEKNEYCSFRKYIKKTLGQDWLAQIKEISHFNDDHTIVHEIKKIENHLKYFNHGSLLLIK